MSHPAPGTAFFLVLDLETTGLDETAPYASILEFGAYLTRDDQALTLVADATTLVRPPMVDEAWVNMHPAVRDMHTTSGLWNDVTTRPDAAMIGDLDNQLVAWLNGLTGTARIVLAGSGVSHYDQRWLRAFMPALHRRLTYWSVDAGVMRRMLEFAGRDDLVDLPTDVDAKPHRAAGDAALHLAELRRYFELLRSIPRPGRVTIENTPA